MVVSHDSVATPPALTHSRGGSDVLIAVVRFMRISLVVTDKGLIFTVNKKTKGIIARTADISF